MPQIQPKSKGRYVDEDDNVMAQVDLFDASTFSRTATKKLYTPQTNIVKTFLCTIITKLSSQSKPKDIKTSRKRKRSQIKELKLTWTWQQILAYKFDRGIYTQTGQMVSLLFLGFILNFFCASLVHRVQPNIGYYEAVWQSWLYFSDRANQQYAYTTIHRIIAACFSFGGFIFLDVVIGIIVGGIRAKLKRLRSGRSRVVEVNHALVLGWSSRSITFIKELCKAFERSGGGCIVFLINNQKDAMEDEFQRHIRPHELRHTRVVFRSGNALAPSQLHRVAIQAARSVTIFASDEHVDKSDAMILRFMLCLRTIPEWEGHVIADVGDIDNEPLLKLVGGSKFHSVVSHDLIGRLLVMCGRVPGVAKVYESLFGHNNVFLYCDAAPQAAIDIEFGKLQTHLPNAVAIGIRDIRGDIHFNPPCERIIALGECLILLAKSSGYKIEKDGVETSLLQEEWSKPSNPKKAEKQIILICGWRRDIRDMLIKLDGLCPFGSEIHLFNEFDVNERNDTLFEAGLDPSLLHNVTLVHLLGNPAIRRHLTMISLQKYDYFMVVTDSNRETDILASDSHVLATVLLLRTEEISQAARMGIAVFRKPCIAEILDPRTQKTIVSNKSISESAEFVHSTEMVTRILAMVAHNEALHSIIDELLSGRGPSFDIVPASRYCCNQESLSFYQLNQRAQYFNEIICGYQHSKVILNPPEKHLQKQWESTMLIVIRDTQWAHFRKHVDTLVLACDAFYQALRRYRLRTFLRKATINKRMSYSMKRQLSYLQSLKEEEDLAHELLSTGASSGDEHLNELNSTTDSRRNSWDSSEDDFDDSSSGRSAFNFCAYRRAMELREAQRPVNEFNAKSFLKRCEPSNVSVLQLVANDTMLQECKVGRRSTIQVSTRNLARNPSLRPPQRASVDYSLIVHNPLPILKAQRELLRERVVQVQKIDDPNDLFPKSTPRLNGLKPLLQSLPNDIKQALDKINSRIPTKRPHHLPPLKPLK
ncbi:ion channel [Thraustotheca clavata]|uniref:Ion channel n=1 Tax=Thraustotheca clavata TaxID=74557 RepID=A0A1V9Z6Y0_9STRA|nr:ion channel [Thraustotheca clavata]